jgi:hypothetical protein
MDVKRKIGTLFAYIYYSKFTLRVNLILLTFFRKYERIFGNIFRSKERSLNKEFLMKFFILFCLIISSYPIPAAEKDSCEPAESVKGDGFYFSIKKASLYGTDTTYLEVRIPYIYDDNFKEKTIEVTTFLPNNQSLVFYCDLFVASDITDSCAGTYLQFRLLNLKTRDASSPNRPGSGYRIKKEYIPVFLKSPSIWAMKPKR